MFIHEDKKYKKTGIYTFLSSRINDPKASLWLWLMDVICLDACDINPLSCCPRSGTCFSAIFGLERVFYSYKTKKITLFLLYRAFFGPKGREIIKSVRTKVNRSTFIKNSVHSYNLFTNFDRKNLI